MKIPMLERPLRVLDALARGPAGPSELARQTQLPKATVLRILSFLQQRNYAERTAQATWRPGPATLAPAEAWRALAPLPQLAQPLLAELAAATQESAALHLRLADTRLIAARADSPRRVRDQFALGEHLPLNRGAGGLALSTYESGAEPAHGLGAPLVFHSVRTLSPDTACLAMPVFAGREASLAGALVLSAPAYRLNEAARRAHTPRLAASALLLTQALRGPARLFKDFVA
jgi:DNA-binding IclR family transcriptional regulator